MLTAVLLGFLLAALAPLFYRCFRGFTGWILAAFSFLLFAYFSRFVPQLLTSGPLWEVYSWVPSLDINLSFFLDGLSLLFTLLICGLGGLIFIYASGYLKNHEHLGRFYLYLMMFMASMLGVVLSSNLISLFIFWELTSLSSYFLIGMNHSRASARNAALQALLVTGIGGLALLAGFVIMGLVGGSLEITQLFGSADAIRTHSLYGPLLFLIFLGAFTKSAQFPFHFWLPNAMEAPTPVSAYLHSATMVKAGIYLLARLNPVLGNTPLWNNTLVIVGGVTMFFGAFLSWQKSDLKEILAYSTISVLGMLVSLIGLGTEYAIEAMVVFLFAHALSKGALFLIAGAIDHSTGIRNANHLSGLNRYMPFIAVAGLLAALSKIGFPPFVGFIGKELIYKAKLTGPTLGQSLLVLTVISKIFLVAAIWNVGVKPFWGKTALYSHAPHRPAVTLWLPPLFLGVAGFVLGIWPHFIDDILLPAAIAAITTETHHIHLQVWHGWNAALAMSVLTLAAGLLLFGFRLSLQKRLTFLNRLYCYGPACWYEAGLTSLKKFAAWQTGVLQNGYLRNYLLTLLSVAVAAIGWHLWDIRPFAGGPDLSEVSVFEVGLCLIILCAAIAVALTKSLLSGIITFGIIGYGIAFIYVLYEAPDLALTQFVVETLTVILFMALLARYPALRHIQSKLTVARDLALSLLVGGTVTGLMLMAGQHQPAKSISEFFAHNSYLLAHGRNVVNAVIVDFRALDTLGEITVLAVAGLGVYALLKSHLPHNRTGTK